MQKRVYKHSRSRGRESTSSSTRQRESGCLAGATKGRDRFLLSISARTRQLAERPEGCFSRRPVTGRPVNENIQLGSCRSSYRANTGIVSGHPNNKTQNG